MTNNDTLEVKTNMKIIQKFLSIMVGIALAAGALPAAYASGLSINKWNGFTGAGVTVSNPDPAADSDDDVIKLVSGETATLSLPTSVSSNMLVTFDFYAPSAQSSKVNVLTGDGTAMGSFSLSDNGKACGEESYETAKWQTAKILVYPDGKIYRTYLGDTYLGESEISAASLVCEKLEFKAGGEFYINNINVYNYALPVWEDSKLRTIYSNETETVVDAATPLFAVTEVPNAVFEANADAASLGEGSLKMILAADNGEDVEVINLSGANVPEGEFNVKVNVSAESQTADVYVNDEKVSDTPVSLLDAEKNSASVITEVALEVTGEGSVSVKSLYIKEQSPIKNPAGQSKKILFEEDFDEATVGAPVPYFEELGAFKKMGVSFTTVDAETGHASSNVGMLKQQNYYSGETLTRFNDDGTVDTEAEGLASGISDTWYRYDLSKKAEGVDNITLKFKYYNAKNANSSADGKGVVRDRLFAGFGTVDATTGTGQLSNTSKTSVSYYVNPGEMKTAFLINGSSANGGFYSPAVKSNVFQKWVDAELSIVTASDGTVNVTIKGTDSNDTMQEQTGTIAEFPVIRNLSFELNRNYGGKYYIDDIEVSTIVTRDEDEYYTPEELMDISKAVITPAYTNDITIGDKIVLPNQPGNADSSTDVWNGTVDTSWYDASAEEYEIQTGAQLAGLAKLVNESDIDFTGKTVKLMANIDLANRNWTPIGTGVQTASSPTRIYNSFKGTFDGNGHEVRNLKITETVSASEINARYFGLFGRIDGSLANLGVNGAKVFITANGIKTLVLSGLVANITGTMEKCYVVDVQLKTIRSKEVEKTIKRISDGGTWAYSRDLVAPLAGQIGANTTVNSCYARDIDIYASWHAISAGLVALSGGQSTKISEINNSYSAAPFRFTTNPATGERGRFYNISAKQTSSNNIEEGNYYSHNIEEYIRSGIEGVTSAEIYGNVFGTFSDAAFATKEQMAAAFVTDEWAVDESINDGYPYLIFADSTPKEHSISTSDIEIGDKIEFKANLTTPNVYADKLIFATYDKDNRLVDVVSYNAAASVDVSLPVGKATYGKLFWWNMMTLESYCNSVLIQIK